MTEVLHEIPESEACPKCGSKLPPRFSTGRIICGKCGWTDQPKHMPAQFEEKTTEGSEPFDEKTAEGSEPSPAPTPRLTSQNVSYTGVVRKIIGIGVIVIGVMSSISFFKAASQLDYSGRTLTILRSEGGTSVAEAYYQEIGRYGLAYSSLAYGLSLGVLAVSCGFGGLLITSKE
jgi:ribosomal protein S27AE